MRRTEQNRGQRKKKKKNAFAKSRCKSSAGDILTCEAPRRKLVRGLIWSTAGAFLSILSSERKEQEREKKKNNSNPDASRRKERIVRRSEKHGVEDSKAKQQMRDGRIWLRLMRERNSGQRGGEIRSSFSSTAAACSSAGRQIAYPDTEGRIDPAPWRVTASFLRGWEASGVSQRPTESVSSLGWEARTEGAAGWRRRAMAARLGFARVELGRGGGGDRLGRRSRELCVRLG